jgi:hypothetical protein
MSVRINQPFDEFTDTAGKPLENGYIYIGTINLNPETNAIAVYANAALTVPIAQPIRTIGGYPSYFGAPTRLYTAGDYSITVKSSSGVLVFSDWATLSSVYDYVATSLPTPNTVASRDTNGASQFADSTGANSGYAVTSAQTVATTPGILGSTSLATVSTLMARDSSGRARVVDPSNAADISTKNYVDTTASTINAAWAAADAAHAALTTAHGAVSTATASTIVIRDSSSRARVADPSDGADIATKGYVDSNSNVAASFISGATIDNLTTFGYIYSGGSTSPTGSEATTYPATNGATTGAITSTFNTTSPLAGTKDFKLAKGSASSGIGWYYPFTMDPAYFGSVLQIQFPYWNTTTDSDFQVFLWDVTNANFISLSTQAINATPASGTGVSPGTFFATFIAPAITTSRQFRLYVHSTVAGTVGNLNLDNITVGRYITPNAAAVGAVPDYVFGSANLGAISAQSTDLDHIGDKLHGKMKFTTGGAPGASAATVALPSGLTASDTSIVGWFTRNSGTATTRKTGIIRCKSGDSNLYFGIDDYTTAQSPATDAVGTTVSTGSEVIEITLTGVPIAQWTTNINLATDFTEYAYNTSTSTTTGDTSSFASGQGGAAIQVITSNLSRRVRFQRPIQSTDRLSIELSHSSDPSVWYPFESQVAIGGINITTWSIQNTTQYGVQFVRVAGSKTDVDVWFSAYSYPSGATFGSAGSAWTGAGSVNWRVRKVSNGNMAEVPPVVRASYSGTITPLVLSGAQVFFPSSSGLTKIEDTHSAISNVSTGIRFTAPIAGVYRVELTTEASVATTTNANFLGIVLKNGVSQSWICKSFCPANLGGADMVGSRSIRLSSGDYVEVKVSGTGNTLGNIISGTFCVERIGS